MLLQYCALLAKSFPSYCEKEKIVSTAISTSTASSELLPVLESSCHFSPSLFIVVSVVVVDDVVDGRSSHSPAC